MSSTQWFTNVCTSARRVAGSFSHPFKAAVGNITKSWSEGGRSQLERIVWVIQVHTNGKTLLLISVSPLLHLHQFLRLLYYENFPAAKNYAQRCVADSVVNATPVWTRWGALRPKDQRRRSSESNPDHFLVWMSLSLLRESDLWPPLNSEQPGYCRPPCFYADFVAHGKTEGNDKLKNLSRGHCRDFSPCRLWQFWREFKGKCGNTFSE